MTTLTFILVIGVIWSVTSKRKREDILGGFLETDRPSGGWQESPDCSGRLLREWGTLPAESFNRRDNDLKSHRPRRPLCLRGRNYKESDGGLLAKVSGKAPRLAPRLTHGVIDPLDHLGGLGQRGARWGAIVEHVAQIDDADAGVVKQCP
jgi:hypothetical protein